MLHALVVSDKIYVEEMHESLQYSVANFSSDKTEEWIRQGRRLIDMNLLSENFTEDVLYFSSGIVLRKVRY